MNEGRRRKKTSIGSKLEGREKKRKVVASIILRQMCTNMLIIYTIDSIKSSGSLESQDLIHDNFLSRLAVLNSLSLVNSSLQAEFLAMWVKIGKVRYQHDIQILPLSILKN